MICKTIDSREMVTKGQKIEDKRKASVTGKVYDRKFRGLHAKLR